jgi:hypothetical protein
MTTQTMALFPHWQIWPVRPHGWRWYASYGSERQYGEARTADDAERQAKAALAKLKQEAQ